MGQNFTRVENIFYTECQAQLSQLDETLLSLASTVDSVHTTVNLLLCELEKIAGMELQGCTINIGFDVQKNMQLTKNLLLSTEGSLNHQKMSVMQGISQLKRLIKSKSKEQMLAVIPALKNLKINDYLYTFEEKETKRLLSKGRNIENSETNGHQKQTESGKDMEQTTQSLRKEIERIESQKNTQMENNKKMEDDLQRLRKETIELGRKNAALENKDTRHGIIPVQLCYQHGGDQMASVVQDIMSMLSTQDQFGNQKLAFIRCENTADVQSNIPVLVLCMHTSRIGTDAKIAIQGLRQLKNTALLIFHHKDEHALPSQSSDRVLTNPEFQGLGGMFDMAFLSGKGVYHCEKNAIATSSIVTFIEKSVECGPL